MLWESTGNRASAGCFSVQTLPASHCCYFSDDEHCQLMFRSWPKTPPRVQHPKHELVFDTWLVSGLLTPAKGAHFPVGQYETDEMMPNSATLIPCHTPTGSLVFSHMFSHYFHSSWCHGCSHRWWLSLRHITSGSESALCTTAVLWEIMMILCSCPEDPVLLLQTASSVVRKADLYDSDYPPPPHLLTLGRW